MRAVFATILILGLVCMVHGLGGMPGAPIRHTGYESTPEFLNALREIQNAYKVQFGRDINILGHSDYTTQVVAGVIRRMRITYSYKGCGKMCTEGRCNVAVFEQAWRSQTPQVTFSNCSPPPK